MKTKDLYESEQRLLVLPHYQSFFHQINSKIKMHSKHLYFSEIKINHIKVTFHAKNISIQHKKYTSPDKPKENP